MISLSRPPVRQTVVIEMNTLPLHRMCASSGSISAIVPRTMGESGSGLPHTVDDTRSVPGEAQCLAAEHCSSTPHTRAQPDFEAWHMDGYTQRDNSVGVAAHMLCR